MPTDKFHSPIIVHQAAELTADLLHGVPANWIVHCTPSGYMDRDGWFKATTVFASQFSGNPQNIQVLTFDGHDSHFDADAFDYMHQKCIRNFILKSNDSTNDQPNDNGSNGKLRACYNQEIANWKSKFGTIKLTKAHMNTIIVAAWNLFKKDCVVTIKKSFKITKIFSL